MIVIYDPHCSYKTHRYEGQFLYLKSIQLGVYCLIICSVLALFINGYCELQLPGSQESIISWLGSTLLKGIVEDGDVNKLSWVVLLSIGTISTSLGWLILIGIWLFTKGTYLFIRDLTTAMVYGKITEFKMMWCLTDFISVVISRSEIEIMQKVLNDSPMDNLFIESYRKTLPLIFYLESGECYVGFVTMLGEPNECNGIAQEIAILPIMRGYKNRDDFSPNLIESYGDKGIDLVIRQDTILSASEYIMPIESSPSPKLRKFIPQKIA